MRCIMLVILFLAAVAIAQPLEGPWAIAEWSSGISDPFVTIRNDSTADVFYRIGNNAYHAAVGLITGGVLAGPELLPPIAAGWSRQILKATTTDEGWAVLVYDTSLASHRTWLFKGHNGLTTSIQLSSGNFPDGNYQHSGDRNRGCVLERRTGGGCIASWQNDWVYYSWPTGWSEAGTGVVMYVSAAAWQRNPLIENGFVGCYGPDEVGCLHYVSDDSLVIFVPCYGSFSIFSAGPDPFWGFTIHYLRDIYFDIRINQALFGDDGDVLLLADSIGSTPAQLYRLDDLTNLTSLRTLADEPLTGAADPQIGLTWLARRGEAMLLYRADTTGAEYLPEGTIIEPAAGQRVRQADMDMSASGKIATIWTEGSAQGTTAPLLQINTVGWDTFLDTDETHFTPHPSSFILTAFPNPFNSTLRVSYELPHAQQIELSVFNVLGQKVATLFSGPRVAGMHEAIWSPNTAGGIYFVTLKTASTMHTQKVLFLR